MPNRACGEHRTRAESSTREGFAAGRRFAKTKELSHLCGNPSESANVHVCAEKQCLVLSR